MKKKTTPFFAGLVIFQMVCFSESKSQTVDTPVKKFYLDLAAGATTDNGAYSGLGLQGLYIHLHQI